MSTNQQSEPIISESNQNSCKNYLNIWMKIYLWLIYYNQVIIMSDVF